MYLIVGLGNPGREYENTRHNMGFRMIDDFAKEQGISIKKEKFHGLYEEFTYQGERIILLKPQLYMNLSGEVVRKFVDYYSIDMEHLLIVHDDMDLPLGSFRLRKAGSSGGHNGLKDIEKYLATQDYQRLKIGISHQREMDTKDYVLGKFTKEEQEVLKELENTIMELFHDFIKEDFSQLMSMYNRKV